MTRDSVVYTAIYGGYDELLEPKDTNNDIKYICFTDNEELKSNGWEIRIVEPRIYNDSCRSARYIKINAHLLLPEFKYSMYVDGNMLVKFVPDIPKVLCGHTLAMEPHTGRDCIYAEAAACKRLGKDDADVIDEQVGRYKKLGYPQHAGLYGSGLHFKEHNNEELIERCALWWKQVSRYSLRDQISFPVIFEDFPIQDLSVVQRNNFITVTSLHPCLWKNV